MYIYTNNYFYSHQQQKKDKYTIYKIKNYIIIYFECLEYAKTY
jgi:hypothetical protein